MKKNFFKNLAFVVAFAMTATTVAPVGSASAAASPNLAARYSTVYDGSSHTYAVKNATGYTVKWTVSGKGKSYVALSKTTGAKTVLSVDTDGAKAAKNAAVTVTANFYKGKKLVKKAGDGVAIKVSATAVDITTSADVTKIPAGKAVDFNRTITPANATSATYWSVTDKDGKATTDATINAKGELTASKVGDYIVVAETKNAKTGKVVAKDTQAVTAVLALDSAAQESTTKLDTIFTAEVPSTVTAANFSITKDSNSQNMAIKEIKIDGKKVTVTTYEKLNDGASYTVKYGDSDFSFVATNGTVATLAISPATIQKDKATTIKVATKDANGVEIDSYDFNDTDSNIDFDIETSDGYTSDDKLTLPEIGDTAKATATYHTYKYDDKGTETGVVKAELTITAVAQSTAIDSYKYTVDDDMPDWDDTTLSKKLAVNDDDYQIYFTAEDADDNDLTDYTLKSSDEDLLLVEDTEVGKSQGSKDEDTVYADVKAVDDGTAYVLVQDDDGNTIMSLPVEVVAERKATSMKLDTYSIDFSNSASADDTKDVEVTIYDQFGDKMEDGDDNHISDIECIDSPEDDDSDCETNAYFTYSENKATFKGANITKGTYKYKITASDEDITRTVTVKVKQPDLTEHSSYELVVSDSSVDMNFDDADDGNKTVTLKLAEYKDGVLYRYIPFNTNDSISIKNPDGDDLLVKGKKADEADPSSITGGVYTVSGAVITYYARVATGSVVKKGDTGSFTVKVTFDADSRPSLDNLNDDITYHANFTVKDTQKAAKVVKDDESTDVTSNFKAAIKDAFTFWYDNDEIDDADVVITDYEIKAAGVSGTIKLSDGNTATPVAGKSYSIKKVTFNVDVDGFSVPVTVDVDTSLHIED